VRVRCFEKERIRRWRYIGCFCSYSLTWKWKRREVKGRSSLPYKKKVKDKKSNLGRRCVGEREVFFSVALPGGKKGGGEKGGESFPLHSPKEKKVGKNLCEKKKKKKGGKDYFVGILQKKGGKDQTLPER